MTDGYTIVGRVRKPHGIHGELVVQSMCDEPDALFASGRRVFVGDGSVLSGNDTTETREIVRSRPFKEGLLVMLRGVESRNDAELWRDRYLYCLTSELGALDEGEVWVHELIGMHVRDTHGTSIGDVCDTQKVPQGLLIDVATPRGPVSIPFVDAIVVNVDREARTLTIDPPEGLLDL